MGIIAIEGMDFHAPIGCFAEEKIIGTRFVVDVFMTTDTRKAELSDHLADTVNYLTVYQEVKIIMQQKNNLLEHTARQIITCLFEKFPAVDEIRCIIRKMNPPLGGHIRNVSVTLEEKRSV